jgi:RNA recognition motif-containing protein
MFVGGMKDGTTEDDIRETFQDYGTIKEISVIKDKATGKMKGFAFVTFADYDNVDKAVCKYFNVNCRKTKALDIFFASSKILPK